MQESQRPTVLDYSQIPAEKKPWDSDGVMSLVFFSTWIAGVVLAVFVSGAVKRGQPPMGPPGGIGPGDAELAIIGGCSTLILFPLGLGLAIRGCARRRGWPSACALVLHGFAILAYITVITVR